MDAARGPIEVSDIVRDIDRLITEMTRLRSRVSELEHAPVARDRPVRETVETAHLVFAPFATMSTIVISTSPSALPRECSGNLTGFRASQRVSDSANERMNASANQREIGLAAPRVAGDLTPCFRPN